MPEELPVTELAAAYLRHQRTRADEDFWAWEEVTRRINEADDADGAWRLVQALVATADEAALGAVGAGPLEDFIEKYGTPWVSRIETAAAADPKFKACLTTIWLRAGDLPADVQARIVAASGGMIKPLEVPDGPLYDADGNMILDAGGNLMLPEGGA